MIEAEHNVIGLMLTYSEVIPDVTAVLTQEMFASELDGLIFAEIVKAYNEGIEADTAYLAPRIECDRYPIEAVNERLLYAIQNAPISSVLAPTEIKAVYDEYVARSLRQTLSHTEITTANVYEVVNALSDRLGTIRTSNIKGKTASEIAAENGGAYFKKRDRPLMKTGYGFLDDVIGGLDKGDMVVIGARPAVGKTAFGVQLALQVIETGYTVQLFNLEMTERQIYERMISYYSGIPQIRLRTAEMYRNDAEEQLFKGANEKLETIEGFSIVTGSKSVSQIRREVQRAKPDLVIIDYLQLIKSDVAYRGNRYAEVGAISHAIKAIAIDLDIPVIVMTQLNRMSEGRDNKAPTMSEIRESGDIEQDASIIILLWNKSLEDKTRKGCKIEKNRHGETGKVELKFNGSRMRFENADEDKFKPRDDNDGFMTVPDEMLDDLPFIADEG